MTLKRRIASRSVGSFAAIVGASIFAFVFLRIVPSDPARLVLGDFASQEAVDNLTSTMGLDKPLWIQYWNYIVNFVQGDWGYAYSTGEPVTAAMGRRMPATIELGLFAFMFSFVLAIVLAILATYRRRPIVDGSVRAVASFGLGTPRFFIGLVALILFSRELPIFPGPEGRLSLETTPPPSVTHLYTVDALIAGQWATFWDAFMHLVLPAIVLGLPTLALLTRLLRANLLDVSREPFILVARAKGMRRRTAFVRHALPNAFLPTLAVSGIVLGHVIAGSVLVEQVFNWPGVGAFVVDGILAEDYAPVQAFVLLAAIVYVLCNLLADVVSGIVDPRVRVEPAT